jgi:hypothetical protein
VYLGADVPTADVARAVRRTGARAVVLGLRGAVEPGPAVESVRRLAAELPEGVALLAGGMGTPALEREVAAAGARVVPDLGALEDALRGLGGRS